MKKEKGLTLRQRLRINRISKQAEKEYVEDQWEGFAQKKTGERIKDALIDWLTYRKKQVKVAEAERKMAEEALEKYKQRFRKIGAGNVQTDTGMAIQTIELKPTIWGNYFRVTDENLLSGEHVQYLKSELARTLAEGLLNEDLVQYIIKESSDYGPMEEYGTIGAKLYVIPWEDISWFKPMRMMRFKGVCNEERAAAAGDGADHPAGK